MDEYNWDDWDAQAAAYLNDYGFMGPSLPNSYLSDADYAYYTSPISQQELFDFTSDLPSLGEGTFYGLSAPIIRDQGFNLMLDPTTGGFLRNAEGDVLTNVTDSKGYFDPYSGSIVKLGSTSEGLDLSPPELRGVDVGLLDPDIRAMYADAFRNPITGKLPDDVADALDFYRDYSVADPTKTPFLGSTSNEFLKYGRDASTFEKIAGGLSKVAEAALKPSTSQAGTTIKRNPDGSVTISKQQRQPSAAEQAANMALALYQLTKKDKPKVKARESTIQDIGPKYQAARPVRTLYAKGGKVELPESVGGGLLPIAMKIAEMLIAQNGGEAEMPRHKGLIGGEESGQEDNVEAMLSPGEYVIDAEIVSALGDGNTDAGAKKLDQMRYNIRKHKRTGGLAQIAPKAKSPEKYMKG